VINKITNLLKQMSENEKKSLHSHIVREYALEEKTGMLRDDIVSKVIFLLEVKFRNIQKPISEYENLQTGLDFDPVDVLSFSEVIAIEFKLDVIEFPKVMSWQTVADIVDYIEDNLEGE